MAGSRSSVCYFGPRPPAFEKHKLQLTVAQWLKGPETAKGSCDGELLAAGWGIEAGSLRKGGREGRPKNKRIQTGTWSDNPGNDWGSMTSLPMGFQHLTFKWKVGGLPRDWGGTGQEAGHINSCGGGGAASLALRLGSVTAQDRAPSFYVHYLQKLLGCVLAPDDQTLSNQRPLSERQLSARLDYSFSLRVSPKIK